MNTVTINTSELIGPALDWAVAKCIGYSRILVFGKNQPSDRGWVEVNFNPEPKASTVHYNPSEDLQIGGPYLARYKIETYWSEALEMWVASSSCGYTRYGPTRLVAGLRAIVASKIGDAVEVPKWLAS